MPLSRSRDYLSIGEVLESLKKDFPDISISKIRFLESEGLIEPERTGSGYRKFFEKDIEALRYILTLQRDHFLPLKVIKERLRSGAPPPDPVPATAAPAARRRTRGSSSPSSSPSASTSPSDLVGIQIDQGELLKASKLSPQELADLEEYGILAPGKTTYDEDDLLIAQAAKGFFDHGVEARHLRIYRQTTEREAAFIEQLLAPVARRKDPQGLKQAGEDATKLAQLSRSLRDAMLRANVKSLF